MIKKAIILGFIFLGLLSGCSNKQTEIPPTALPSATETIAPTFTPTEPPTPTITSTATEIPTPTVSPTPDPNRFTETGASIPYSYVPPKNWIRYQAIGTISGWRASGDMMLVFQELGKANSAQAGAKEWVDRLFQGSTYEVLSEGPFENYFGIDAYKIELKVKFNQGEAVYYFSDYYFQKNNKLVNASYHRYFGGTDQFDSVIDEVMKTFQIPE